jgi:hypothetical protein
MSNLVIRNYAESQWDSVLESQVRLGLGSISATSSRVEIELHQAPGQNCAFTCQLLVLLANGEKHQFANTQPGADTAVEGVIARARRAMVRRGLMRASAEGALVNLAGAGPVRLR